MLLCTSAASEPARAIDGAVAVPEADEVDAVEHAGWSVVVIGSAAVVTDPAGYGRPAPDGPALVGALAGRDLRPPQAGAGYGA